VTTFVEEEARKRVNALATSLHRKLPFVAPELLLEKVAGYLWTAFDLGAELRRERVTPGPHDSEVDNQTEAALERELRMGKAEPHVIGTDDRGGNVYAAIGTLPTEPGHGMIELPFAPTDDPEITCIMCASTGCAFEIKSKGNRGSMYSGLCAACRAGFAMRPSKAPPCECPVEGHVLGCESDASPLAKLRRQTTETERAEDRALDLANKLGLANMRICSLQSLCDELERRALRAEGLRSGGDPSKATPCAHSEILSLSYEHIATGGRSGIARWCVDCGALSRNEDQPYPFTGRTWRLPCEEQERRSEGVPLTRMVGDQVVPEDGFEQRIAADAAGHNAGKPLYWKTPSGESVNIRETPSSGSTK